MPLQLVNGLTGASIKHGQRSEYYPRRYKRTLCKYSGRSLYIELTVHYLNMNNPPHTKVIQVQDGPC